MMLSFLIRAQRQTDESDTPPPVAAFEQRTNILCWADTERGPCNTPGEGSLGLCQEHRKEKIG